MKKAKKQKILQISCLALAVLMFLGLAYMALYFIFL
mgnify:FL=1